MKGFPRLLVSHGTDKMSYYSDSPQIFLFSTRLKTFEINKS